MFDPFCQKPKISGQFSTGLGEFRLKMDFNMGDLISKWPATPFKVVCGVAKSTPMNLYVVSFYPGSRLTPILCMHSGYDHLNRQFQSKILQHKNSNISKTINLIESKFEDQPKTLTFTSRMACSYSWELQYGWRPPSWKSLWRYKSIDHRGWSDLDEIW